MIETIRQGLQEEGVVVSISQLCRWFEVPRRTFYYQSVKAPPKVQLRFAEPIKAMIEDNPFFGYRTVAHLLGFNKNTEQRVFQLRGWQVRKRPGRVSAPDRGTTLGSLPAQRTQGDRSVPRLDGAGWLGHPGDDDRLLQPGAVGVACFVQRQIAYS